MSTSTEATMHVLVGWNDDFESAYVHEASAGEAEGESGVYEGDVPEWLWTNHMAARAAYDATLEAICERVGFDTSEGRLAKCCPQWEGDVTPGRTHWTIILSASGDENTWPIRDVDITYRDTENEAKAFIAALPEEFHLLPPHGPFAGPIRRERLSFERGGFGPWTTECRRCGWERDAHADRGTPS